MANATNEAPPPNYMLFLQSCLDNGLWESTGKDKVKLWNLKVRIEQTESEDKSIKYTVVDDSNSTDSWLKRFVTVDPKMLRVKDKVRKLAPLPYEVLITGSTGTGKELIARALHSNRQGRFIAVNCAGIPDELLESIMFGHVKGSFTGATYTKSGAMLDANDGTLFLDEIGELDLQLQSKLLRAIQERKITKVGADKEEEINCRIVCATNRCLTEMIQTNKFRIDLYARISTFELHLTPLIDRKCDVVEIIKSIKHGEEYLKAAQQPETLDVSLGVRSLQRLVIRWKVLGE